MNVYSTAPDCLSTAGMTKYQFTGPFWNGFIPFWHMIVHYSARRGMAKRILRTLTHTTVNMAMDFKDIHKEVLNTGTATYLAQTSSQPGWLSHFQ